MNASMSAPLHDPLWTIAELIAATGGTLTGGTLTGAAPDGIPAGISGINFDSRLIQPGDLFIALPGEDGQRDGHDFVANAFANGAALALVSRPVDTAGPLLLVPAVLKALERLGIAARDRCPAAKRLAVTGSVGKTSVTRAILAGLKLAAKNPQHAHGPDGSFNNHIGVPLTLARMPRDTDFAVFEIGMNHAGEITPLTQLVAPQVAVITNVGPVHTEHFADGEIGVARAKAEIFAGVQPGGTAILDRDSRWFDYLQGMALAKELIVLSFGTHPAATARLLTCRTVDAQLQIDATINGVPVSYKMQQAGQHWAINSLAVLLALEAVGVSRAVALAALGTLAPIAGRGARHRLTLANGTALLIDESYNANPLSMQAALRLLGQQPVMGNGRKLAVLTDMLELGADAAARHAVLADEIAANHIDLVFCAGPLMQSLWDALPLAHRGGYAPTAAQLAPALLAALAPADSVMVKGSKGSKASTLVTALLAAYPGRAEVAAP